MDDNEPKNVWYVNYDCSLAVDGDGWYYCPNHKPDKSEESRQHCKQCPLHYRLGFDAQLYDVDIDESEE